MNILSDFVNLKDYSDRKNSLNMNLEGLKTQVAQVEKLYKEDVDSLNFVIKHLKTNTDEANFNILKNAESALENKEASIEEWRLQKIDEELEITAELMNVKGMIYQLPLVFLFAIIWLSIFGGLILAVVISYFGNVYHELYNFKEDDKPTYFKTMAMELNSKDRNQPLLGFTLLILFGVIVVLLSTNYFQLVLNLFI